VVRRVITITSSCFLLRWPYLAESVCNVTVWHPSVRLSRRHSHRDSPGASMRRGQRTFRPDNKDDRYICLCTKFSGTRALCGLLMYIAYLEALMRHFFGRRSVRRLREDWTYGSAYCTHCPPTLTYFFPCVSSPTTRKTEVANAVRHDSQQRRSVCHVIVSRDHLSCVCGGLNCVVVQVEQWAGRVCLSDHGQ